MRKIDGMDISVSDVLVELKVRKPNVYAEITKDDTEIQQLTSVLNDYEKQYKENWERLSDFAEDNLDGQKIDFSKIMELYPQYHVGKSLYGFRQQMEELVEHRCPICDCSFAYSQVTLDHILPKKKFPRYSITPINLVPTCYNCNMRKNDKVPSKVLHPYFHGFNTFDFLSITINVDHEKPFESTINIEFIEPGEDSDKKEKIENIDLYKLREKYLDLCNIAFLKILDEFQQVIRLKDLEKDVYSIDRLKMLFNSLDNFIEIEGKYNFIDENFLRHLCIEVIRDTPLFLDSIAEKLNNFDEYNTLVSNSFANLIEKRPVQCTHLDNSLELIKDTLPFVEFIGLYKFENNKLILERFRGSYQTENDIFCFCPKEDYFTNIMNRQLFSTNKSILLSSFRPENVIGTEIVLPLQNGMFCILLIRGFFKIEEQKLEEFQKVIKLF